MTVTKVVRFSDHEVSTSHLEPDEEYGTFVTKRTFELLDQEEPFLEKQFKILHQAASEHCEAWKENLKEVVGPVFEVAAPVKQNASRCIDCIMETIHRAQIQNFVLKKPKTLAMVGGPAPYIEQDRAPRDTKSLLSTIELDEKPMRWVAGGIPPGSYSGVKEYHPVAHLKPKTGIMKKEPARVDPMASILPPILREDTQSLTESLASDMQKSESSDSLSSEAEAIIQKHKSLLEAEEPHIPSGQRPESPIKLFSSQDLEEYLFQTNGPSEVIPGNDPENPIVVDDLEAEGFLSFENGSSHERMDVEGEERDQPPPSSPILQELSILRSAFDRGPIDFHPIENFTSHSHVPLSRSLLFSMRSRNRDIENLLAEIPTEYFFAGSADGLSRDDLRAASSTDSHSCNISQENSIDSTGDFNSSMTTSNNSVHNPASQKKNFKFISFRGTSDALSTASAPPCIQVSEPSLSFPLLVRKSNE
ncbi:hypothetical protein IV203_029494 [Nitzschia inconspicua]|uniref:Uncharacterized protein n=1 Tax=Nitzschia inconspicua TaxID=303405 RepID=A0A9K3Q3C0_9STRA|nr:hypothetical protein IV203_029494 [Nitzschia inconspicua]